MILLSRVTQKKYKSKVENKLITAATDDTIVVFELCVLCLDWHGKRMCFNNIHGGGSDTCWHCCSGWILKWQNYLSRVLDCGFELQKVIFITIALENLMSFIYQRFKLVWVKRLFSLNIKYIMLNKRLLWSFVVQFKRARLCSFSGTFLWHVSML